MRKRDIEVGMKVRIRQGYHDPDLSGWEIGGAIATVDSVEIEGDIVVRFERGTFSREYQNAFRRTYNASAYNGRCWLPLRAVLPDNGERILFPKPGRKVKS